LIRIETSTITTLRRWFPEPDLQRVRIVRGGPVCWYVRYVARQGAMTIAPFVFYGRERYDPSTPRGLALLAHELLHVQQYRAYGHARFLLLYLRDLARARFRYSADLPLERPCYNLQAQVRETLDPTFI
jgi:hypothetical protein